MIIIIIKTSKTIMVKIKFHSCIQKALPATIGILDGRIKVGLTRSELERLAESSINNKMQSSQQTYQQQLESHRLSGVNKFDSNPQQNETESGFDTDGGSLAATVKTSRRDLAYVLASKLNGGTTVAGTLMIANMVGIKVFATGGIGGVHREGESTLDISADLIELGRNPVAVICSGAKSILDIPRTLEFLETQGVFVASYQSEENDFPTFYTRKSGVKTPYTIETPKEAARLIKINIDMELGSGLLIGVPIPEEFAIDETLINNAINEALKEAKKAGIEGKEVTPFLLAAVSKLTKGRSLESSKDSAETKLSSAYQLFYLFRYSLNKKQRKGSC